MKNEVPKEEKVYKILPFGLCMALCLWGIAFITSLREQETVQTQEETVSEEAFLSKIQSLEVLDGLQVSAFGTVIQSQDLSENISLNEAQLALLKEFMNRYMESLAYLDCCDFSDLFLNGGETLSVSSIRFQIGLRQMTPGADYSLLSYRYVLNCVSAIEQEDGSILVSAQETSIQVFAQTPDVESKRFSVVHTFTMVLKNGEWYLTQHEQADCLYLVLKSEGVEEEDIPERYVETVGEYLELIREQYLDRLQEETEEALDEPAEEADFPYDRAAALAYSYAYIYKRNSGSYVDYSGLGGNCQNYVSQCLFAGGIPMDIVGDEIWKWYDARISNTNSVYGRSSSWTGVDEFVLYAQSNTGYGLVAEVDAPYFTGEAGDVLQFGTEGDWRHAVIITDVVCDENGTVIDYLVNSNTSNLENYPASLYGYPEVILTKIIGWNEE
ncbi:MAG: amidase domain-containing protein [Lachnospiraceae bacterium]|nr:amidase domain-containing protein [Lachnospiraceae bacterium]